MNYDISLDNLGPSLTTIGDDKSLVVLLKSPGGSRLHSTPESEGFGITRWNYTFGK